MSLIKLLFLAWLSHSAGFTGSFKIKEVHLVDSRGFMIVGEFPKTECTSPGGTLFVESTATQYKNFLAAAFTAKALNSEVNIYFNTCKTVGFYVVPEITFPAIVGSGGNFILK